ncbi:hypothetical protein M3P05_06975 [Sansalvadorimonas sp. 2012CJ34-2]|uniref:MATH domain-containing protein n=1 Tax=Parendozoicomonas callyspongiae TaxID=2942213 RepID=A0ABT0PEE2_9GAMM|nr:MATH domain-containing protein [Sansalvadorimonas sp. 2012CJ34-2]MCL6269680.1 hypothetical protein [Sansalvadorimonas sp. 2012CJ34-2]
MKYKKGLYQAALFSLAVHSAVVSAGIGRAVNAFTGTAAVVAASTQMVARSFDKPIVSDEQIRGGAIGLGNVMMQSHVHIPETMSLFGLRPRLAIAGETIHSMNRPIVMQLLAGGHSQQEPSREQLLQRMATQTTRTHAGRKEIDVAILADQLLELQKQNQALAEQMRKLDILTEQMAQLLKLLEVGSIELKDHASQLKKLEHDISDLEHQIIVTSIKTTDGRQIWRVPEVEKLMQDAKDGKITSLCSAPFYTGPNGYRLCLRAYLNGDGIGEGLYLSVFIVLMRGEYDPLLEWPFDYKVTIALRDQSPDIAKRKDHVRMFRSDKSSSSYQRPVKDMNIASGVPEFIPLSKLKPRVSGDLPDGESWFVVDDTLFLDVKVEPVVTQPAPEELELTGGVDREAPEDMEIEEKKHL